MRGRRVSVSSGSENSTTPGPVDAEPSSDSGNHWNGADSRDFNPFEFTYMFRGHLGKFHTGWLGIVGVVIVGALLIATTVDNTFGTRRDFQAWDDFQRTLGADVSPSAPSFPLVRDPVNWFLAFAIVSGALLLHRQWQCMSTCLSGLMENGAIAPREKTISSRYSRLLAVDKKISGVPSEQALTVLVATVMASMRRRRVLL